MSDINLDASIIHDIWKHEYFYREMLRIRRFEEKVLNEFTSGSFRGTTHTYIGQEAIAVGVISELGAEDIVVSNHRSHGHFLAYGGDMRALFAELMGKPTGVCGGRGGSQHLHWKNFYSNGVLGGTSPIATGMALAEKLKKNETLTVIFMGDGALGEGVVYEALNMASLWSAPILFVIENNHIAQTTPIELNLSGSITERFSAFGITTKSMNSNDVVKINSITQEILNSIRQNSKPQAYVIDTHRFAPHSKGDDTRDKNYIETLKNSHDPIPILAAQIDSEIRDRIELEVSEQVDVAFQTALDDPLLVVD